MSVHLNVINTLRELQTAYHNLSWYQRIFFPTPLAKSLRAIGHAEIRSEMVLHINQSFEQAKKTPFFNFFQCLNLFGQSSVVTIFRWLFINSGTKMPHEKTKAVFNAAIEHEQPELFVRNYACWLRIEREDRERLFNEKTMQLPYKIKRLSKLIIEDISHLEPLCREYQAFLNEKVRLTSIISECNSIKNTATKILNYNVLGSGFYVPQTTFVYVEDWKARREATERSQQTQTMLAVMQSVPCPNEYARYSALCCAKNKLEQLNHELECMKTLTWRLVRADIQLLCKEYDRILIGIKPPSNQRAEYNIQALVLTKVGIFSELPKDLQKHIAEMVVSPNPSCA